MPSTDDIVKRLRRIQAEWHGLEGEAADEIERLRAKIAVAQEAVAAPVEDYRTAVERVRNILREDR